MRPVARSTGSVRPWRMRSRVRANRPRPRRAALRAQAIASRSAILTATRSATGASSREPAIMSRSPMIDSPSSSSRGIPNGPANISSAISSTGANWTIFSRRKAAGRYWSNTPPSGGKWPERDHSQAPARRAPASVTTRSIDAACRSASVSRRAARSPRTVSTRRMNPSSSPARPAATNSCQPVPVVKDSSPVLGPEEGPHRHQDTGRYQRQRTDDQQDLLPPRQTPTTGTELPPDLSDPDSLPGRLTRDRIHPFRLPGDQLAQGPQTFGVDAGVHRGVQQGAPLPGVSQRHRSGPGQSQQSEVRSARISCCGGVGAVMASSQHRRCAVGERVSVQVSVRSPRVSPAGTDIRHTDVSTPVSAAHPGPVASLYVSRAEAVRAPPVREDPHRAGWSWCPRLGGGPSDDGARHRVLTAQEPPQGRPGGAALRWCSGPGAVGAAVAGRCHPMELLSGGAREDQIENESHRKVNFQRRRRRENHR